MKMLKKIKLKIREILARKLQAPEIPFALERLARNGFRPGMIFDVGAYQGDFAKLCLKIWPSSKVSCFEAQEHKVRELKELASQNRSIQVFPVLLGAESGERVPLHEAETASSVFEEQTPQNFPVSYHPMETIDRLVTGGRSLRIFSKLTLKVTNSKF